jgi:hypothetical protein
MNTPIHKLPFQRQCELVMAAYVKQHPDATDEVLALVDRQARIHVAKVDDPVGPPPPMFANLAYWSLLCSDQIDYLAVILIGINSLFARRVAETCPTPFKVFHYSAIAGQASYEVLRPYEEFESYMQEMSDQIYALLGSDWTPDQV